MTSHLPRVIEAIKPQLVFYQAGVDPLQSDRLGGRGNKIMPSSAMQFSCETVDRLPRHALEEHITQVGSAGRLALSREGLQRRNDLVYELLRPSIADGSCGAS